MIKGSCHRLAKKSEKSQYKPFAVSYNPLVNAIKQQQQQQSFHSESQNLSQLSESTYQSSESNNLVKQIGNKQSNKTDSMIKLGSAKYSPVSDSKEIRVENQLKK
ncbi:hypothetical protein BpHYR1_026464 [Brachionus plicatilis]|uniref:Uncharacterized protein n=1 Tax=Brachionus plicatilis TaxID=10195 RepID=A0A3M7QY03_BRAPC|nr:hypothetical protein BpHYR1_026464 [Brachionus plicatilis]